MTVGVIAREGISQQSADLDIQIGGQAATSGERAETSYIPIQ